MKANLRNRQNGNESDRYQAVKIFTDREDPQEAFERKLRRLSRDETWKEEFYVLSYYGIGGIGKSSFLRKLCRVIKKIPGNDRRLPDPIDCHYFLYDFGSCDGKPNKLSVLLEWRVQLGKQNPKFRFEQFDAALVTYGLKTGRDLKNNSTVSSLLEAAPWLAQLFSAVDSVSAFVDVPGISDVTKAIKVVKLLDNAVKAARNQRLKAVLREMRQMEPVELMDNLHTYFAEDMQENMMEIAKKPVVILLDTYEKFVDAENREREMMTADHWLRKGPNSVIQQIPGILWVISGRERLRWSEDDDMLWDEDKNPHAPDKMTEEEKEALAATGLEQHRLGDLSLADATAFLQAAGVRDETLWEPIYKLTKGTPFYLDICVNIANVREAPSIADFGKNIDELVVRFFQGLTDQSREMLCFLSCLGSFTDEIVFEIAEAANRLNYYSKQWYREFVLHSVIVPCEDGSYYVHETVRVAALKKVDEDLAAEIYRLRLKRLQKLVQDVARLDIADVLADYVAALVEAPIEDSEFESHLRVLLNKLGVLYHTGEWTVLLQLIETLFRSVRKSDPESTLTVITRAKYCGTLCDCGLYARALEEITAVNVEGDVPAGVETADWLELQRMATRVCLENLLPEQALTLAKQTNELHKRKLGEDHRDTFSAMNNLANAHKAMGEGTTALYLRELLREQSRRMQGEDHPDTLVAMSNLASSYRDCGQHRLALDLLEQVLERREQKWGEDHPDTLMAMQNLAVVCSDLKMHQRALELCQQVLDVSRETLGEDHPETLRAMQNLAVVCSALEMHQRALELCQQVLDVRKVTLGEDHPETLKGMNGLADAHRAAGEHQQAADLWEQLLKLKREKLGEDHPEVLEVMRKLSHSYNAIGNRQRVLELLEEELEWLKRKHREDHPLVKVTMIRLVNLCRDMGEHQKAQPLVDWLKEHNVRME